MIGTTFERGVKTRSLSATDADWIAAQQLANSNTNGNISKLFAEFVHRATMMPEQFFLNQPSAEIVSQRKQRTVNEVMGEAKRQGPDNDMAIAG